MKHTPLWPVIARRELAALFQSPVAWIVMALFLAFSGLLFLPAFFLINRAELRGFFSLLPILFSFFIPAITMRAISEEKRSGTIETLLTLPVSGFDVIAGKFAAVLGFVASMLLPTLSYVFSVLLIGSPDPGPLLGGYIGALVLASAFASIGLFASTLTRNQIVAFFAAFAICITLTFVGQFAIFLPAVLAAPVQYLSVTTHFESIARGIVDTRDILYFASLTCVFFGLAVRTVDDRRSL